jgi:exopolysaccharide biosynthesis protein
MIMNPETETLAKRFVAAAAIFIPIAALAASLSNWGEIGVVSGGKVIYLNDSSPRKDELKAFYAALRAKLALDDAGEPAALARVDITRESAFSVNSTLFVAAFAPDAADFKIAYSADRMNCGDFAKYAKADFCVNGGFFAEEPLGLLIADGETLNPPHPFMRGFFYVTKRGVPDIAIKSPPPIEELSHALQSFPALLHDGLIVFEGKAGIQTKSGRQMFSPEAKADRSVVAVDKGGKIVFAVTMGSGFTFHEIASLLAGMGIKEAFCLDGGASAQMYFKNGKSYLNLRGDQVPALIHAKLRPRGAAPDNF